MKTKFLAPWLFLACCAIPVLSVHAAPIKVALVGDSTVIDPKGERDMAGWGWGLKKIAGPEVEVENFAVNGRDAKNYLSEGWWGKVLATQPDWVIIQFGHEKNQGEDATEDAEFSELLRQYVTEAKGIGAKPILVTPVSAHQFKPDGTFVDRYAPYAAATIKVAEETHVPVLDLYAYSKAKFIEMGPEQTKNLAPMEAPAVVLQFSREASGLPTAWVATLLQEKVPELGRHFNPGK